MNIQTVISREKRNLPEGKRLLVTLYTDRDSPRHLVVRSVSGSAIVGIPVDASASTAKTRISDPQADQFLLDVLKPIRPTALVNADHVRSAYFQAVPDSNIGSVLRDILEGSEPRQEWVEDGFGRHPK